MPPAGSSQHIKAEPVNDDYGYDESSGEVYYGNEGYDIKGHDGYRYDNEGYMDQAYSDTTSQDQFSCDAYGGDPMNTGPLYTSTKPPPKRRKVSQTLLINVCSSRCCVHRRMQN